MSSQLTVYKASAGSGKTFTLAREYMTLVIANPASYRTILAPSYFSSIFKQETGTTFVEPTKLLKK